MDKQTSEEPWLSPKGGYSRRVVLRSLMAAGASASGLGLLVGCGSSAVEVAEEPTVTRIPVEGAPTDVPADFVAGASPVVEEGGEVAEAAGGQEHVVEMTDELVFVPDDLTINVGDTVTWTTVGAAPHTSTADPEQALDPEFVKLPEGAETWDSGLVPTGESFSHTFEVPGEYVYFCTPHQMVGMVASLTVVEGGEVAEASPAGEATAAEAGAAAVELEGYDIGWRPETLSVPVGGTINMYNSGAAQHTFVVEGYNEDAPVDLPIGGEIIEWQVPEDLTPGEYVFYCDVPGHREAGMEGVLTITEAGVQTAGGGEQTGDTGGEAAAEQGAEGASVVQLEGYDIGWTQTDLQVPSGGVIEMKNVGSAEHTFVVEGYNEDAPVDLPIGGEVVEWQVPADLAPGEYVFYCDVPGHREAGMEGVLTITEAGVQTAGGGEQ
ncbi:MAG TPA: plastocyanin/azurin family copper-binding protein, partial [Thermomicrobiales bacterium]|nr:plastocyanin/azurin family copper-binding protein [Thermomicrobiales bacterium]